MHRENKFVKDAFLIQIIYTVKSQLSMVIERRWGVGNTTKWTIKKS
jgi:hypothetical protein